MKTNKIMFVVFAASMTAASPLYGYDGTLLWEGGLGTNVAEFSAIRISDLDGDGTEEIIVGNQQGFVHILGQVSGEYAKIWKSPNIGTPAFGLAVGDSDGDTEPEIVAGTEEGFFYIFGRDAGTWVQEYVSADIGREIWGVDVGDTDGDGSEEIVLGSREGIVRVFGFDGASYVEEWASADLGQFILDVSTADTDGNGSLEIVVGGGWSDRAYIFEWNGAGYAQTWVSDSLDSQNFGVAVANLDADPTPELIASTLWGYLYVFSPGGGTTPEWTSPDLGSYLYTPAAGDADGDGTVEFAVGERQGDVSIFGYSGGAYLLEDTISTGDSSSDFGVAVRSGDPDNDSNLEWVTGGGSGIIRIYGWRLPAGYEMEWYSGPPNGPMHALAAGDLDGDGPSEAVVGISVDCGGEEMFILNCDSGDYSVKWTWPEPSGTVGGTMVVDDLDGIAGNEFAYMSAGDHRIHVFHYSGGTWTEEGSTDSLAVPMSVPVTTGNYDGSAPSKIAVPGVGGNLYLYGWNGATFEETWSGPIGFASIAGASSADTDGDTLEEIIMLDMTGTLRVWGWDGSDFVEEWASASGTFGGTGVSAADCDEDSVVEFAAGDSSGNLLIYAFSGGVYNEEASIPTGGGEISGAGAGDVDSDGRMEFAVFDRSGTLSIAGYESGAWIAEGTAEGLPVSPAMGMNIPDPVAVADIDGSGHPEVIVGLEGYLEVIHFPDTGLPEVTVISPNGGETIEAGSSFDITWSAVDIAGVDHVDIDYSVNAAADWTPVAADEPNDGSYPWSVPAAPSTECLVRITAWDAEGNSASDMSDDLFEIILTAEPHAEEFEIEEAEEFAADVPDTSDVSVDMVTDIEEDQDTGDAEEEEQTESTSGCSCQLAK